MLSRSAYLFIESRSNLIFLLSSFMHPFPFQLNFATQELLISLNLENGCTKDSFSNLSNLIILLGDVDRVSEQEKDWSPLNCGERGL